MADLSFNVIALDKAGATFIKLAEQVDRLSDRLERLDGKTVTADVNVRTDESRKALDSFTTRYQLMAAGIAAASPAIGASIIAGVGAGFIGIAAVAQSSNQQVQTSYKNLWHDVVSETKNSTNQLVPQLTGAANAMDATVKQLGPSLARAFSFAGPDIVALTRGINDAANNAMPGLTTAMQNSLPVMEGLAGLMGTLGQAGGDALASLSQHADALGTDFQSFGSIVSSVLGAAVSIIGNIADAWAASSGSIDSAIGGITTTVSGLAQGVLPIFTAALGAAAAVISGITDILGPLAPMLGTVGAVAAATWAAFKLAGVAKAGVQALAEGVVSLGGNIQAGAGKAATYIAGLRGVEVQASATASRVATAGEASAVAATRFGAATEALAGPLGIALVAGTALFGLFASATDQAVVSEEDLKAATDTLASAFLESHGALSSSVVTSLQSSDAYKKAADAVKQFGISQSQLSTALTSSGGQLDSLKAKLQGIVDAGTSTQVHAGKGYGVPEKVLSDQAQAAKKALDALRGLSAAYRDGQSDAEKMAAAQGAVARTTMQTPEFMAAASSASRALGLSLSAVSSGFTNVMTTGEASSDSVEDVAAAYIKSALGVAQAQQAITDHFQQADKAVASAKAGVASAAQSYQSSLRSISDAQHGVAQAAQAVTNAEEGVANASHGVETAQRSLRDAYAGVTTAQRAYAQAQQGEIQAQRDLNKAREQAIEDLKALHLQLADQQVSELQARVGLFDATTDAAKLKVNAANAHQVAGQTVNATNEAQIKAALALLSAQNQLNNTLNTGGNLRKQVAAADRAGIAGSAGVVSAQKQVKQAHEQVMSALQGVRKAQLQVRDASYSLDQAQKNLAKAHQAVTDAAYNEQKAQQAVSDAQANSGRSAQQLKAAKQALTDAQKADSRSLDINTKAGQQNLALLLQLWTAIGTTGMTTHDRYNAMVGDTAKALGVSTSAAVKYLKQLGLIPKNFKYSVTAVAGADLQEITQTTVNGVKIFKSAFGTGGIASAGRLAAGGRVVGMGGPRDDANLIWASHNEFMQPADVVDHYGLGVMEAMRSKRLKVVGGDGAHIPGFADGGLVEAIAAYTNLSTSYVTDVNTLGVMGMKHPKQLPKYVPPPIIPDTGSGGTFPRSSAVAGSPAVVAIVRAAATPYGWGSGGQWNALSNLVTGESGWDPNAQNPTSTAYGLFQFLNSTWAGTGYAKSSSPAVQSAAGMVYIDHSYHSAANAYGKWLSRSPHWYDNGGWLNPGQLGYNGTNKPEAVFTQEQLADLKRPEVHKHFHFTAQVTNQPVSLRQEFAYMQAMAGPL